MSGFQDLENRRVQALFLSAGNVCGSVHAEAIFNSLIEEHRVQDFVLCASKASRDYNVGESPDLRAVAVAEEMGLSCQKELQHGSMPRTC